MLRGRQLHWSWSNMQCCRDLTRQAAKLHSVLSAPQSVINIILILDPKHSTIPATGGTLTLSPLKPGQAFTVAQLPLPQQGFGVYHMAGRL